MRKERTNEHRCAPPQPWDETNERRLQVCQRCMPCSSHVPTYHVTAEATKHVGREQPASQPAREKHHEPNHTANHTNLDVSRRPTSHLTNEKRTQQIRPELFLTFAEVTLTLVFPALETPMIPWSLCTNRVSSARVMRSARMSTSATVCNRSSSTKSRSIYDMDMDMVIDMMR